jgi:hypothetical protein
VLLAAVSMAWPALWSGYPSFLPDSIVYMSDRWALLKFLFGGPKATPVRAEIYSIALWILHRNVSPWPVVALYGMLVAWMLWLTVRSLFARRPLALYLVLVVLLDLSSTVAWYVCLMTPDVLGGVLYLGFYLLLFARATLSRWEAIAVMIVCWWSITAHPTHLMVTMALCGLLAILWLLRWRPLRGRGQAVLQLCAIVLVAVGSQFAVNARLYGKLSLLGDHPPYALARLVADGPSRVFLQEQCWHLDWVLCKDPWNLPWNSDEFLWNPTGVWQSATPAQQVELDRETWPLLRGVLHKYPRAQIKRSLQNVYDEITNFGILNQANDNPWLLSAADLAIHGAQARIPPSSARLNSLPRVAINHLQERSGGIAALIGLLLLWVLWKRRQDRLIGLGLVVYFVVVFNSAVTGLLSEQSERYPGRIAWLLPMLAAFYLYAWLAPQSVLTEDVTASRAGAPVS